MSFYDFGINVYLVRELSKDKSKLLSLINTLIFSKIILIIFGTLLALASLYILKHGQTDVVFVVIYMLVSIILINLSSVIFSIFRSHQNFNVELKATIIYNIFFILGSYLIWENASISALAISQLYLFSRLIFFLFAIFYFFSNFKTKELKNTEKMTISNTYIFFKNIFPFGITSLITVIYINIDSIIISYLLGDFSLGVYQSAFRLIMISLLIIDSLDYAIFPRLSSIKKSDLLYKKMNTFFNFYTLVGSLLFLFFNLFSNELILIIYGSDFQNGGILLKFLSWVILITFVQSPLIMTIQINKMQTKIAQQSFWSAILLITLSIYLTLNYNLMGTVVSLIIARSFGLVYVICIFKKYINIMQNLLSKVFVFITIIFLISLFTNLFFENKFFIKAILFFIFSISTSIYHSKQIFLSEKRL